MKIKLTEDQLKKIIRSELGGLLNESQQIDEGLLSDLIDMVKKAGGTTIEKIKNFIQKLFGGGKEPSKKELSNLKDLEDPDFLSDQTVIPTGPKSKYNFDKIPDGKNNYRSAQLPLDLLSSVIEKYDIKTIIRFNGDGGDGRHGGDKSTSIKDEEALAKLKGVNFFKLSSTRDQSKVNEKLKEGNVLIHCAHGADRTGGNVGGYFYDTKTNPKLTSTEDIWRYTTRYNDWNYSVKNTPNQFVSGGFLAQAQKFGVRDIEHAKELAGMSSTKKEINSDIKNIIIGDSQVPWVDMNTKKASKLSEKGGPEALWESGKTVPWLIKALEAYQVDSNVENVIIVIGSNGAFGTQSNDNIPLLFRRLREKFPNAEFYAVQGFYGVSTLKNITDDQVKRYYQKFSDEGATVIEPGIGKVEPHGNRPVYKTIGAKIDSYL